jgi:hypothetical protein
MEETLIIYDLEKNIKEGNYIFNIQYPDNREENIIYNENTDGVIVPRIERLKVLQRIINRLEKEGYSVNIEQLTVFMRNKVKYLIMQRAIK